MTEKDTVRYAIQCHGNQKYGSMPYIYHLHKVAQLVKKWGGSAEQIQAAYLHDTVEDTDTTLGDIQHNFGSGVAQLVGLLTNQVSKEATFKRIRTNRSAVLIKLCDRLANVTEGGKLDKYRKEHPLFKSILYKPGEFDGLWNELDRLLKV